MLTLGIDLDGVMASFDTGYREVLFEVSGKRLLPEVEEPPCWYWPQAVGYTKEEDDKAWTQIKESAVFWVSLPPTMEAPMALRALAQAYQQGHNVYFITNRMGIAPHMQSMIWLINNGFPTPTVILSGDKGPVAKGLGLTHFIDDKPENCFEVKAASPKTRVAMLSKRYNQSAQEACRAKDVEIVSTIKEFFQSIAREEELRDAVLGIR